MKPLISKTTKTKTKYTNSCQVNKTYFLDCAYEEDAKGVIIISKSGMTDYTVNKRKSTK